MDNNKRILHMNDNTKAAVEKASVWAEKVGKEVVDKLDEGLDYLRRFSGGTEEHWATHLNLDICYDPDRPSFIATVYKRVEGDPDDHPNGLKAYMTIGMIYRPNEEEWSFHS